MHFCRTLKPSLVEFVHHSSSLPSWLYNLPAESNACYEALQHEQLLVSQTIGRKETHRELMSSDLSKRAVVDVTGPEPQDKPRPAAGSASIALTNQRGRKEAGGYRRGRQSDMNISAPDFMQIFGVHAPHWQAG